MLFGAISNLKEITIAGVAARLVSVRLLACAKGGEYDRGVGRKRREETELE